MYIYEAPEIYDLLYMGDRSAEVYFLDALFQKHGFLPGSQVIEIAAGTGVVALALARMGWNLTALDLSSVMIEKIAQISKSENLAIECLCEDMSSFEVSKTFSAAFCPLGSIGLLNDLQKVSQHLQCVAKCLEPNGIYVIDVGLCDSPTRAFDYQQVELSRENETFLLQAKDGVIEVLNKSTQEKKAYEWGKGPLEFNVQDFTGLIQSSGCFELEICYPQIDEDEYGSALFDIDEETEKLIGERVTLVLRKTGLVV